MARVKLSEFRAKHLFVGPDYQGVAFEFGQTPKLAKGQDYVLKVDQGVKKRGQQGLLVVDVNPADIKTHTECFTAKGYTRYLLDPLLNYDDDSEHYVSFDRTREGIGVNYTSSGGMEVEEATVPIKTFLADDIRAITKQTPLSQSFVSHVVAVMNAQHVSFAEFNPLIIQNDLLTIADAAVLVDSAGEYFADGWSEDDIVEAGSRSPQEEAVKALDNKSPAALKLRLLNPNGSLWLLLSGGGASVSVADTVMALDSGDELGNYGEYSGGPTTDETYLYAKEVLDLAINSKAKKKALVIAGGVANFTDVAKTFAGIIQAIDEQTELLKNQGVKVFVRRGGPNEVEGLKLMKNFLESKDLLGSIAGSDIILTDAIEKALDWLKGSRS